MGGHRRPSLILWVTVPLLLLPACAGSSSHSMSNLYTAASEPGHGLPQFIAVGYMDDQVIAYYDSDTRRKVPAVPWMQKVEKDDDQYWERYTQMLRGWEQWFKSSLENLRNRYNQSKGFHTLQLKYGCELRPDGSKRGFRQYAYDGRDFISFDKDTLTWTAADTEAQITKRSLDAEFAANKYRKGYLEETCIEWLLKYLVYGKEVLLRTEPPVGKVTRQALPGGRESLICQAYGFYPKEIYTTWRKDGEAMEHSTFRRDIAPNSDGTYHAWLSIDIDPQDRDSYWCHVEHDGLPKPLVLAWEKPANVRLTVITTLGVLAVVLIIIFFIFFTIRRQPMTQHQQVARDLSIPT